MDQLSIVTLNSQWTTFYDNIKVTVSHQGDEDFLSRQHCDYAYQQCLNTLMYFPLIFIQLKQIRNCTQETQLSYHQTLVLRITQETIHFVKEIFNISLLYFHFSCIVLLGKYLSKVYTLERLRKALFLRIQGASGSEHYECCGT